MKTTLSALLCLLISYNLSAQVDVPYSALTFRSKNQVKTDSGYIYITEEDNKKYIFKVKNGHDYTLYNENNILLVKGKVKINRRCEGLPFKQYGRWTSYYANGNIKANGIYKGHHAVGYWETFYQDGDIKEAYFLLNNHKDYYTSYKNGPYYSYHKNGELSSYGWYKPRIDTTLYDTIYVDDPVTGETTMLTSKGVLRSFKVGTWSYYNKKGELLRKETN